MRLRELRGLPVIDPTGARKVGTVTDYQIDTVAGRIAALDVHGTEGGNGERIPGHRIRRVGQHAVILTGRPGAAPSALPESSERWLDIGSLEHLEVMGDDGNRIGHLIDGVFDQDSLEIEAYLLQATFWERLLGRRGRIPPSKVHACSRELMIVTTGRMQEPATTSDETHSMAVPLKPEDRLAPSPSPARTEVSDGQTVGAR